MITKFQRLTGEGDSAYWEDCTEEEATHILYSHHDEKDILGEALPCRRVLKND